MRILRFNVDQQIIEADPNCDFTGLIPGTEGYLKAEFTFSQDWNGLGKIAIFSFGRNEYPVRLFNNSCVIPKEVLDRRKYYIHVTGVKPKMKLTTNKIGVKQNG